MVELTDDELLAELGATIEAPKARAYSQQEERIIAGFEDIERFYEEHVRHARAKDRRVKYELACYRSWLANAKGQIEQMHRPQVAQTRRQSAVAAIRQLFPMAPFRRSR